MAVSDALLAPEWHPTKNGGVPFLGVPVSRKAWWLGACGHEWETSLLERRRGSGCPVCSGKKILVGFNDLASKNPTLATEWHPTKNVLTAEQVSPRSSKKSWWLGVCGHEWEAKTLHRANGSGCPFCSGHTLLPGFNDLETMHPVLAAEWHPTKNGGLSPKDVYSGASKSVWWLGVCGHEWEALISNRVQSGTGCHFCSGFKVLAGFNDLATTNPDVALEWHPLKNQKFRPDMVASKSGKKVWWLCPAGHEWQMTVASRVQTAGCLICNENVLVMGVNDLASQNPTLTAEWHPTKNGSLLPSDVFKSSSKTAWWLGACGHEWEAKIANRNHGAGCPTCGLKRGAIKHSTPKLGLNDLATIYPDIAKEWHPTKNTKQSNEVLCGTKYRATWICAKGHEWKANVSDRSRYKTKCPVCAAHNFISKPEHELFAFLTELGLTVEQSNRTILGENREIDLWLPEQKVGIEFNGLYWHDEAHKGQKYHHDKYMAAKAVGVQLIQVWEDDWNLRKQVIMKALAHKLGVTDVLNKAHPEFGVSTGKVFARKTFVRVLNTLEAQVFLNQNHIQGFASGSYYVGLQDSSNNVVAVLVLRKEQNDTLNIIRYATSVQVVGGFTKLLSYAEKMYQSKQFITFADHTVSDGGLYENNGFTVDKVLAPDYMYVVKNERQHKFGYRLKRFRNDPDLLWQEGLTERELAELNRLPRIWDAGKTRYVKNL